MIATIRALGLVSVVAFKVSPRWSLLSLAEVVGRVLGALNPLLFATFATGAFAGDVDAMIFAVVGLAVTTSVNIGLDLVGTNARLQQGAHVGFEFERRVSTTMATIETLDHHENPELLDQTQVLRDGTGSVGTTLNSLMNLSSTVAFSATTVVVALTADWRLLVLVALGALRLAMFAITARWDKEAEEASGPPRRLTDRLVDLSHDVSAGAETRVFGLRLALLARIRRSARDWQAPEVRRSGRQLVLDLVNGVVYFGAAMIIVGLIVRSALNGTGSVAAVTIALTSVGALQAVATSLVGNLKYVGDSSRAAVRYVWLRDYAADVHAQHVGGTPPALPLRRGIALDDVTFRYPGAERDTLHGIDLDLPAGSVVAVVGENGAGKTTLVKLLTGMYAPTSGRVLVDGTDLAELDLTAWRRGTTGAFQDHANLELLARESIGLGDVDRVDDETAVRQAMHDAAASDVLTALPEQLSTQLGADWPAGVGLSGGQWQRLAIARGMMRRTPALLVLDEPTSALDAATEHALFDRYAASAGQLRTHGGVTLLITHRFSTVAAADLVVVLAHGRVVERGTHAELIDTGGHYAELYELQARGYR